MSATMKVRPTCGYNPFVAFWKLLRMRDDGGLIPLPNDRLSQLEDFADRTLARSILFAQTAEAHGWLPDQDYVERVTRDVGTNNLQSIRDRRHRNGPL